MITPGWASLSFCPTATAIAILCRAKPWMLGTRGIMAAHMLGPKLKSFVHLRQQLLKWRISDDIG